MAEPDSCRSEPRRSLARRFSISQRVARLSNADGLHVGQDDLSVLAARAILGSGAIVGLSTHTEPQIESAVEQTATYVAVGPVFGTSTKDTGYAKVGLARVRYAADRLHDA